jgi:endogenous inhibitor of DNA gyrase (YacG/DUF329 family)
MGPMTCSGPALCVLCRRHPVDPAWRPFCSERCKTQDLAFWAEGTYRVAGERQPQAADGPQSPGDLEDASRDF